VPWADAVRAYRDYQTAKGNRPRSIETTAGRLERLFPPKDITGEMDPDRFVKVWEAFIARGAAVDTARNVLAETKTFVRWLMKQGWVKDDFTGKVEVLGKRKKGKPQLTIDETRRFVAVCQHEAARGDIGAVAALTALLLGVRNSEIADRIVRDLDDQGRVFSITSAKTAAGVRRLTVPEVLRPHLVRLAEGKKSEDLLFGVSRHSILKAVKRMCRLARTPIVSPHGLRGTHATLAVATGISSVAVAASLGHESFNTTRSNYARPESLTDASRWACSRSHQLAFGTPTVPKPFRRRFSRKSSSLRILKNRTNSLT
jgi:integrase